MALEVSKGRTRSCKMLFVRPSLKKNKAKLLCSSFFWKRTEQNISFAVLWKDDEPTITCAKFKNNEI